MANINGAQRDAVIYAALATLDQDALTPETRSAIRLLLCETLDRPSNGIADGYAPGAVIEVFRRMLEAASRELDLQVGMRPGLPVDFGNPPSGSDTIQ